ncbi:MAG: hypothetical protein AMS18_00410 [Gemmatimonas sp. SG8_17]|nr:MAG: hypothetical protein AMS18_00410 [Gemmatimonas sp. SG8_17]
MSHKPFLTVTDFESLEYRIGQLEKYSEAHAEWMDEMERRITLCRGSIEDLRSLIGGAHSHINDLDTELKALQAHLLVALEEFGVCMYLVGQKIGMPHLFPQAEEFLYGDDPEGPRRDAVAATEPLQ